MDAAITSGPVMTTIGVGAVFVALALLIAVVVATSRLIDRRENGGGKGGRRDGSDTPTDHTHFLHIALAAYALHRRSSTAVRRPEPPSRWGTASRVAQRERSPGKT